MRKNMNSRNSSPQRRRGTEKLTKIRIQNIEKQKERICSLSSVLCPLIFSLRLCVSAVS